MNSRTKVRQHIKQVHADMKKTPKGKVKMDSIKKDKRAIRKNPKVGTDKNSVGSAPGLGD